MTKAYTEQTFRSTYRDDYADSDNYYRVLFNSGRALQARELTQLQTIIQEQMGRMGSNLFKEGAPIQPGGVKINNSLEFVKIATATSLPSDLTTLNNVVFTGQSSGIVVKVLTAIAADDGDPDTIYVQYLDLPSGSSGSTSPRVTAGETLSGTVGGSTLNLQVQTTNTTANPATGTGSQFSVGAGSYFVIGHFVYNEAQSIILSKYSNNITTVIGFRVVQDIVTVQDTDELYDNTGTNPNLSSPGADRYRIRLVLADQASVADTDTFISFASVFAGRIVKTPASNDGFNSIRNEMAQRTFEESGNYIKKYFKANFEPNDASSLKLRVEPGTAYINGYRAAKEKPTTLFVPRAQDTVVQENDAVSVDYGNYLQFDSGKGMFNFGTCEQVNLYTGSDEAGDIIGTARVRALTEGVGSTYRLHLFDIQRTNDTYSLRDILSVGDGSGTFVTVNLDASGNSVLQENTKKTLLFDTPIARPKTLSDVVLTTARKIDDTTDGAGSVTISLSATGETFVNTGDWVISTAGSTIQTGYSIALGGGSTSATVSGLPNSTGVEILAYVRKANGKIRQKTLTQVTDTALIESDGSGVKWLQLDNADIYSVTRIRKYDSDGDDLLNRFTLDAGQRDGFYDRGRLYYNGLGLDSEGQNVFVRYDYFAHGTGDFFAVNSYTGQVDYKDIPAHRLDNGNLVSLRDVLDFRPSLDATGSYITSRVSELPQPTDVVTCDAEYYLPRLDKLILSQTAELRYITGTSSLQPKYPSTPKTCIDLYKFEMNPNTLHSKDLSSTIIPLKGYTMEDIGKIEKKLDKIEEMTTLTMLELATVQAKLVDSAGNDRLKSGFLVDNFVNQRFSDTKNPEYRAAIDPRDKFVRPKFRENSIDLHFDSSHAGQLRVVKYGDMVMLDHDEVPHTTQDVASRTINVNPFNVERLVGNILLSPASDNWKESQTAAPRIVDGGTELDTRQALLWNNWEWNWGGVDINDLQVGDTTTRSGTSTTTTVGNTNARVEAPALEGSFGAWASSGTVLNRFDLRTAELAGGVRSTTEEIFPTNVDVFWIDDATGSNANFFANGASQVTTGGSDVITTATTNQTVQTTGGVAFNGNTNVVSSNTTTSTTVNRVVSEATVREVVNNRVIDVAIIPWMRSRVVSFRAEGLRPNSRYFPFFDGADVAAFCRQKDFIRHSDRDPTFYSGSGWIAPTIEHSEGSTDLVSDVNGKLEGEFEIPSNSAMRFSTGRREFALYDISDYNSNEAISIAFAHYVAEGSIETRQDTVLSTRVLEVSGTTETRTNQAVTCPGSLSTSTLISASVATDVTEERTNTEIQTNETRTDIITGAQPTGTTTVSFAGEPTPDFTPDTSIRSFPTSQAPRAFSLRDTARCREDFWFDPLAQSFAITDPNGMFVTRVRVYFAEKDTSNMPVTLELRPMINGYPSSSIIPGSSVTKAAANVNVVPTATTDSMLSNGTDFVFEEPVYLSGGEEYSIVLRSSSMEYKVYISQTEDFVLGSTERRITKQPTLGSLFISQNASTWQAAQTQDLAFRIYSANFETSGNAILENVNVTPAVLTNNPFLMTSGSNVVRVINEGHGLRTGDKTYITGLDSATTYSSGLLGTDILGQRTVIAVDGTGYKFLADSSASSNARFGGGQCTGSQTYGMDLLRLDVDTLQPETTNITFSGKFTTNSSLVDSDTGRFTKDATYQLIKNKNNYEFTSPRGIFTAYEESTEIASGKSATIQCTLTTTDPRVSPVIDMQRASIVAVSNLIDKQDSAATSGFNVPINFVDETDPFLGSSLAKHVTIPVSLAEEAVGLKILFAGNRPSAADFLVYFRTADEGEEIRTKSWTAVDAESSVPSDENRQIFREYRYLAGGLGGTLDPFTQFQVKVVMRSSNSSKVPMVRDLRAIALSV